MATKREDSEEINAGLVGMGKIGIMHTGILSSLDGVVAKWLQFLKLVRCIFNSEEDYVKFQQFPAEWILDRLKLNRNSA